MQSRYRDDEDGGGPRILESQPEYSQSIHRVLMMNSLPHMTIPQMFVAKILFPEILEKFILPIYSPPFSIIRSMTKARVEPFLTIAHGVWALTWRLTK